MLIPFLEKKIAKKGTIGAAECVLCDAVGMADLASSFLKRNSDLFLDDEPVPRAWYH
jgi:hypothetical protein